MPGATAVLDVLAVRGSRAPCATDTADGSEDTTAIVCFCCKGTYVSATSVSLTESTRYTPSTVSPCLAVMIESPLARNTTSSPPCNIRPAKLNGSGGATGLGAGRGLTAAILGGGGCQDWLANSGVSELGSPARSGSLRLGAGGGGAAVGG